MRAIIEQLPCEDLIYLGDTARVPYGNRGADTVRRYALNAAALLESHQIKALVVACNTASAYGLEALRAELSIPVFGVISPVARRAAEQSQSGNIAVLGTRGTIRSGAYQRALRDLRADIYVEPLACPLLVPLAEEGWLDGVVAREVLQHYLADLSATEVDTIILGCTHYPILRDTIADVTAELMTTSTTLLDSAQATTRAVARALRESELLNEKKEEGSRRFLLTDLPEGFVDTAERFFGRSLHRECEHVDIVDTTSS